MPEIARWINQDTKQVEVLFETTPIMSTYLLCLVVCKYDYYEDQSGPIPVRVYAPSEKIKYAKYAAGFAAKVVSYFNNFLGIKV